MAAQPYPWQMTFQPAASPLMEGITYMHDHLLIIIVCIAIVVILLMAYILIRFRASRNTIPSRTSHHTLLEIIWTLIPVVIVVLIAVPSLKLLFTLDKPKDPQLTIKVTGRQWYWTYEYPGEDATNPFTFDSYMLEDADRKADQLRLLAVDNPIFVPVDTTVRVLVTSSDVLHSFAVPSLGVKKDAVPGRINETWFRIKKEGTYYGQCSELCGVRHGFMPIEIKVVSKEKFDYWLKNKGKI